MAPFNKWLAVGAVAVSMALANTAQAELKRITIGSNPAGSVFFLLATGFAKLLQEKLKIKATAQPHAGSSVYLPLMDTGEITLGLNNSMDSVAAYTGKAPFKRTHKNVRALARVWVIPYGFMVKTSSGLTNVRQLRGKRVVTDIKSIVSLNMVNRAMLTSAGMTVKDVIELNSGGIVRNVDMIIQGRADAAPVAYSMPAVRKAHATVPGGITILRLDAGVNDAFMAQYAPGARTIVVTPNKGRPMFKTDTLIAAFDTFFNAGKQVSNEDAYRFTKTLHENWKAINKAYAPTRSVKQAALAPASNMHPYHDGAIKYYKEVGLWSAANAKQQAAVSK